MCFSIKDDVSYRVLVDVLYQIKEVPLYPKLIFSVFVLNWRWISLKGLSKWIDIIMISLAESFSRMNHIDFFPPS